jgi:hypothetical protein
VSTTMFRKLTLVAILAMLISASGSPSVARGGEPDRPSRASGSSDLPLVWVRPYVRHDGVKVRGHLRTAPDDRTDNNFGPRPRPRPNPKKVRGWILASQTKAGGSLVAKPATHPKNHNPYPTKGGSHGSVTT